MEPKYKEFGKVQIDDTRIDETCNAYSANQNVLTLLLTEANNLLKSN